MLLKEYTHICIGTSTLFISSKYRIAYDSRPRFNVINIPLLILRLLENILNCALWYWNDSSENFNICNRLSWRNNFQELALYSRRNPFVELYKTCCGNVSKNKDLLTSYLHLDEFLIIYQRLLNQCNFFQNPLKKMYDFNVKGI